MCVKIVADSSCDLFALPGADFVAAPLTISAGQDEFIDDENLDTAYMMERLREHKGRSFTACPGIQTWLDAFGGADTVYVVTITSGLSGTYNAAMAAGDLYMQSHPEAKVRVFDTLSTGPEMRLLLEKLAELTAQGLDFEETCRIADDYLNRTTRLFFSLESLHNLVQNGRVSKLLAAAAGLLGLRFLGTASAEGTLQQITKCRGERKLLAAYLEQMQEAHYAGGKVRISHADNESFARQLGAAIREKWQSAEIAIYRAGGLCSYYAEKGGVLLGCECAPA